MREDSTLTQQAVVVVDIEVTATVGKLPGDLLDFFMILREVSVDPDVRVLGRQLAGQPKLLSR